jgi:hypothetical protein
MITNDSLAMSEAFWTNFKPLQRLVIMACYRENPLAASPVES